MVNKKGFDNSPTNLRYPWNCFDSAGFFLVQFIPEPIGEKSTSHKSF
jgi:hypothetical protein